MTITHPEPVICAACVPDYLRSDGICFEKGDWIELLDRGVGKFMGVWQNNMGLMTGFRYYRKFSNPTEYDTLWYRVGGAEEDVKPCLLDTAFKVSGPLKPNGKRPERLPIEADAP